MAIILNITFHQSVNAVNRVINQMFFPPLCLTLFWLLQPDYAARIIACRYVVQITIRIDIEKFTVDVPLAIIVLIQNHFMPFWGDKQTGQAT